MVSECAMRFSELSRHASTLVFSVKESVCRFIEGLNYGHRFSMARELVIDTPFQQVVEIDRRLEHMRVQERERPRDCRGFSVSCFAFSTRHDICYVSPVHSVIQATRSSPSIQRPQNAHFAQPLSSVPPAPGAYNDFSSLSGQTQFQQPRLQRGCFECGDTTYAYVRNVNADSPAVESVVIVRDILDVFPVELPSMLPDRDIDFCIDLVLGTQPISIPPYHIEPVELKELKEQLQELLDKGFIMSSVSP
ncbi:uncharacterized protein [Nicotiana tomentosiformis]|uniref:uncharacterized protein n=1 Tax=Nicotiana tomentosiformis TaxID=4098 RepID=UPI00388CE389